MSAIIAIFHRDGSAVSPRLIQTMLAGRPQRGPDGARTVVREAVALAHQHFWLLPEEWGEEQPLEAGTTLLSADIRLDNREELGRLLELSGTDLRATSDARLFLHSYQRWGRNCLDYLLGDYAFALWDAQKEWFFCARDALGERDLSYYLTDDLFLAASEISQLLAHPAVQPRINEDRVAAYLADLYDDQQASFFTDIYHLPPAHALLVTAHGVEQWRHWDIVEGSTLQYSDEQEYVEHYRSLLSEAVRCRLRSSGPIAVSLSGGLDSTSLAALAAPHLQGGSQGQLHSFSYAFDELASCDERMYIEPIVDRYQLQAQYVPCDDRWTLKDLPEWPVSRDFVFSDPFALLPLAVMETAQQAGTRLLLAGYFGDTLSGGAHYWALDMLRYGKLGTLAQIMRAYPSWELWQESVVNRGVRQLLPSSITDSYRRVRPRLTAVEAPGMHANLAQRAAMLAQRDREMRRAKFSSPGLSHRYFALMSNSFSQGIAATRHQYNEHGLEITQPYFDRRLVEFMLAVPAYVLGRPGYTRLLQRRAMIGYLPELVWQRPQRTTFAPLMSKGVREKESAAVGQLLTHMQAAERQYVRQEWIDEYRQVPYEPTREWNFLWKCISLELWLRRYWS